MGIVLQYNYIMFKLAFLFCFLFIIPLYLCSQTPTGFEPLHDTAKKSIYQQTLDRALVQHFIIQTNKQPTATTNKIKAVDINSALFYTLLMLSFLLAFFKYFYARYFDTLFRVFFNTTLRQSQLTDQLLQSKLTSLLFNVLFIVSAGIYMYFILVQYKWLMPNKQGYYIALCIVSISIVYCVKYITLKFTGWVTSKNDIIDTYIFIIFLINKIIGIILLPVTIVLAFSTIQIKIPIAIVSLLFIALMLLMRYFRAYGLLQNKLKISRFHFVLYIAGIEIVPLLVLYKSLVLFVK
jgi:Domain of unknown function (DUF4271)